MRWRSVEADARAGVDCLWWTRGSEAAVITACAIQSCINDGQTGPTTAYTQILHALYVAAHATAVALTGYQRDLQHRLEVGARRRQALH